MKKNTVDIKKIEAILKIPEFFINDITWDDCIEKDRHVYDGKQKACRNKKCGSLNCIRVRNNQQHQFLLANYLTKPPHKFIVIKFSPDSELISEDEMYLIFENFRIKMRHISKYKSKKKLYLTFSFDIKVEFAKQQPHFHLTVAYDDDDYEKKDAKKVEEKIKQIFEKTITELENSGELISNVRLGSYYFKSLKSPEASARYLAKAEKDLSKHEPLPLHYEKKRKRLFSGSRNHHPISKKELANIKKVISANKMAINQASVVINENEKSQLKIFVQPDRQTITSNDVIFQGNSQTEETGSIKNHNRVVNECEPKQVIAKTPSQDFDKQNPS